MGDKGKSGRPRGLGTRLTHAARDRKLTQGGVNPVVQKASTVIVESASKLFEPGGWTYGRHGTATHEALRQALCEIEGAKHCVLAPSGLMACIIPFLAFAGSGGHVLVCDNVYGPTRRFVDRKTNQPEGQPKVALAWFPHEPPHVTASSVQPMVCVSYLVGPPVPIVRPLVRRNQHKHTSLWHQLRKTFNKTEPQLFIRSVIY